MLVTPGLGLSDLRCFLFLKQLYWHSTSVAITSFLRGHVNLMFLISAVDTLWSSKLYRRYSSLREALRAHFLKCWLRLYATCSRGFVKSLYILIKMDYNHKIWTVVILLRDNSVGHSSSDNVVATWSRLSEIFSCI